MPVNLRKQIKKAIVNTSGLRRADLVRRCKAVASPKTTNVKVIVESGFFIISKNDMILFVTFFET